MKFLLQSLIVLSAIVALYGHPELFSMQRMTESVALDFLAVMTLFQIWCYRKLLHTGLTRLLEKQKEVAVAAAATRRFGVVHGDPHMVHTPGILRTGATGSDTTNRYAEIAGIDIRRGQGVTPQIGRPAA